MSWAPASLIRRWFDPEYGARDRLIPRWIVLRGLGLIYFSAFFSLLFQIRGLIGPDGILPARDYLDAVARQMGAGRVWFAPTLLWISTGNHMLVALCWAGMIASVLLVANVWPRATLADLLRMFPVVRRCRPGFLRLSIRRHAAGGGIHRAVLRARGISAGTRALQSAVARQPLPSAMGVVSHLLRIGRGEAGQRRSRVAEFHRHG